MGCGTSMSESQLVKHSTSPKKLPLSFQVKHDKTTQQTILQKKPLNQPHKLQQKDQTKSIQEDINLQNYQLKSDKEMQVKDQLVYQSLPFVKEGKMYLFGESASQRKIVSLDLEQFKFQVVASRSRKVQQNVKYQPSDVIFQQSQQLQASHLYNKFSHPPYNFMLATYIKDDKILMCGGINADFNYISDQTFIYQTKVNQKSNISTKISKGNNLLGHKFQKLQPMNLKRYSHMGVYFPMGKLGYVYIFGGRGESDQTLNHCQKYSIQQRKWTQINSMKIKRSTGFSLIFNKKIYLFGGYTHDKKRTKVIEVFDPFKDYWEVLDVKIHRGIQAGIIFSVKPNEILIMGGNMELGTLKSVIKVNLAEKTYIWDSNMKKQRFLQKGAKFNDQIFIFGGDFEDTFQKYTLKDRKWRDQQIQYKSFISPEDINAFTLASETIEVKYDETLISKAQAVISDFQRLHIFGNDQYPCILQINLTKWVLKKKSVPMSLRLRCLMCITKIKQGKYLICGGIDSFDQKCSKSSYLYYSGTNRAIEIGKLSQKKYQITGVGFKDAVYLFGGRMGKDGEVLSTVQRFDLAQEKWVKLKNMTRERARAKSLVINQQIFIWGGCDSLQNINEIQIFNPKTQQFSIFFQTIPMSSQITGILPFDKKENQLIIFSYNDLLNQHYCHSCVIQNQQIKNSQQQKQDQNGLICSSDLKLNQIKVKIPSFNSTFTFNQNMHLITNKGILTWKYQSGQQVQVIKPQIIINQVQMLQYPIEKFSFSN